MSMTAIADTNPNGVPSYSPGLRAPRATLGTERKFALNPNGVPSARLRNPVGVDAVWDTSTQGSELGLATLG